MSNLPYRADIDGLRMLAVLPVLFYHASFPIFSGGYVGVDVFFVISGFLITSLILRDMAEGGFSIVRFYERRIRRIFPALYVVLLAVFLSAYLFYLPREMKEFSQSLMAMACFSTNIFFWRTSGYFETPSEFQPLLHTWSLSAEEQFYILFPIFVVLCVRFIPGLFNKTIMIIGLFSFLLSVVALAAHSTAVFYLLPPRGWELLLGAMPALFGEKAHRLLRPSRMAREMIAGAGLPLIILPVTLYSGATPFPGFAALPPCLGAMLIIWSGMDSPEPTVLARLLSKRACVGIGLVSYPLYLWHWPLLILAKYALDRQLGLDEKAAILSVGLFLAYATYRLVEKPIRSKRVFASRRALFLGGGGAMISLFCLGLAGQMTDGFAARLPESIRRICDIPDFKYEVRKLADMPELIAKQGGAPLGPPDGKIEFALLGDSHSFTHIDTLEGFAWRYGISGRYVQVHLPLFGVEHFQGPGFAKERFEPALQYLRNSGLKHIVLAARWAHYIYGLEKGEYPEKHYNHPMLAVNGARVVDVEEAAGIFAEAFRETIGYFYEAGIHVYILRQVPRMPNERPCLTISKRVLRGAAYQDFGTSVRDYRKVLSFTDALFAEAAETHPGGVTILDPEPLLCRDGLCRAMSGDNLCLWNDDDHISPYGARVVSPLFERMFRRILDERQIRLRRGPS